MSTVARSLWAIRLAAPEYGLRLHWCMKCKSGKQNVVWQRSALAVAWVSLCCWSGNDAATMRVVKASHRQLFQNLQSENGKREKKTLWKLNHYRSRGYQHGANLRATNEATGGKNCVHGHLCFCAQVGRHCRSRRQAPA